MLYMRIIILITSLAFVVGCQATSYSDTDSGNNAAAIAKERSKDRNPKSKSGYSDGGSPSGYGSSY